MSDLIISALIQAVAPAIIALAVLYQNRILKTQVETQKGVIDSISLLLKVILRQ